MNKIILIKQIHNSKCWGIGTWLPVDFRPKRRDKRDTPDVRAQPKSKHRKA